MCWYGFLNFEPSESNRVVVVSIVRSEPMCFSIQLKSTELYQNGALTFLDCFLPWGFALGQLQIHRRRSRLLRNPRA